MMKDLTPREKYTDRLESIAEEIKMFTGLDAKVVNGRIELETIAGQMKYIPSEKSIMGDVYRFISQYGGKLHEWGLQQKIEEGNKIFHQTITKDE